MAVIRKITKEKSFDLVIADEAYELIVAYLLLPGMKKAPFVMIYDFFGFDATTKSPLEKLGTYFWNFAWVTGNRTPWIEDLSLFVGNILPFDPQDYCNTEVAKSKLGYGAEPLIICAVGGTAIGVELLNLCARTYALLKEKTPDLQMVLVCEHFEQKLVSDKLERLGAGVKMVFSETDEKVLAKTVLENLIVTVDYGLSEMSGAVKAAEFIQPLL